MIAVLCAARKTHYRDLPDVDVYDADRDARTFQGGMPIIAHPPCRSWSAFMGHWAKPAEGERELGLWCCEQLRACGGILEQPAHSRLFQAAELPLPGRRIGSLWTLQVDQYWWGFPTQKKTWLCFSGMHPRDVVVPYRLRASTRGDRYRFECMSHGQRSRTTLAMCEWLVATARLVKVEATRC